MLYDLLLAADVPGERNACIAPGVGAQSSKLCAVPDNDEFAVWNICLAKCVNNDREAFFLDDAADAYEPLCM